MSTVTGLLQVTVARIVSPSRYVSPAAGALANATRRIDARPVVVNARQRYHDVLFWYSATQ